jgi:RNA polymerase sigma-70 factor (ECF subfamily)
MYDTPDAELLAALREGDGEAFAVLVARHNELVRTACLRQAPAEEVDDCLQAVFLVLARRPAAAARAPALAAWLLRVSHFVCCSARRSARRRRLAESDAAHRSHRHPGVSSEALDYLDECLAKLPERQRAAICLQYLAGQPPEAVADQLGVSRENAYQLVSRGLAALRSLLARRGIAISAQALLGMLSGEAQAASASETTSIALALSTTPSTNALSLAHGATTAMTLTAPSTITTAAACLLLIGGVTTTVFTAEPKLTAAPVPVLPAPAPAPPAPLPSPLELTLDQEITLDFQDTDIVDAIAFLQRITNQTFILDPPVLTNARKVTLRVDKMRLRHVLKYIEQITSTTHVIRDDAFFIQSTIAAKPPRRAAGLDLAGADAALLERLAQRVTFDFQETKVSDISTFVRQVVGVNCVMMPSVPASATITLKVKEMRLSDALKWVCEIAGITVCCTGQALVFDAVSSDQATSVDQAEPTKR